MIVLTEGKEHLVPGCYQEGEELRADGLPKCRRECRTRKRCLAAEGEVPSVGIFFGERMPGRNGGGRL